MHADVPGLAAADIRVQVSDGNMLTISGERKREHEEQTDRFHRVERSFGKFSRSFPLPTNADMVKITATVDQGVVTVVIPKKLDSIRVADIPVISRTA